MFVCCLLTQNFHGGLVGRKNFFFYSLSLFCHYFDAKLFKIEAKKKNFSFKNDQKNVGSGLKCWVSR